MAATWVVGFSYYKDILLLMKNANLWLLWMLIVFLTILYLANILLSEKDKRLFMPGEMTGGHHQIGIVCSACHTEAFADKDAIQNACEGCHGEQRKKPFDSHPQAKFTDPRNAEQLDNINALYCVTCHVEHKPEITQKTGLTQPKDFCVHCHQDIDKDRPSHVGLGFETCASAGCHNFHNNRSLYTDFLVKHSNEPDLKKKRKMPDREFAAVLDDVPTYPHSQYPVKKLGGENIEKIARKHVTEEIKHDWLTTAHSKSGATCSSCHVFQGESGQEEWKNKPDHTSCQRCHDVEVKHFTQGKHGMRLKEKLSPMIPSMARLPMKKDSAKIALTCNACHQAHEYKMDRAPVEACLECHDDRHSLAYKDSKHFKLWEKEQKGDLPKGEGVSCATCHMPRTSIDVSEWLRRVVVQHNQNATLVPNEKMLRPVCMNCHGLAFSIDSLADKKLVDQNFLGKPSVHVRSIDMAEKDNERHLRETGGE